MGAVSEFAIALAGGPGANQVASSGALADEFASSGSSGSIFSTPDRRALPELDVNAANAYPYAKFQMVRIDLLNAIKALETYSPERGAAIGQLFALTGYVEVFFGENLCSGVPLGQPIEGQPSFSDPLPTATLFARAVADFDSATAYGADSVLIGNLARVGRARALLNVGRFDDAAAAVEAVPTNYSYTLSYSATSQPNYVFDVMNNSLLLTVADNEGGNGLDFRSASDPRVPVKYAGRGADGATDVYAFAGYSSLSSPVVLASGVEAQLIEAEAALKANPNDTTTSGSGWLGILNALRASAIMPSLPPLADPGSYDARVNVLFRERALWLYATGHRHGDLRRLVRQYGRSSDSVFPTGPYKNGQSYGTDVTFVPDQNELNNPNFRGCLDRLP